MLACPERMAVVMQIVFVKLIFIIESKYNTSGMYVKIYLGAKNETESFMKNFNFINKQERIFYQLSKKINKFFSIQS